MKLVLILIATFLFFGAKAFSQDTLSEEAVRVANIMVNAREEIEEALKREGVSGKVSLSAGTIESKDIVFRTSKQTKVSFLVVECGPTRTSPCRKNGRLVVTETSLFERYITNTKYEAKMELLEGGE